MISRLPLWIRQGIYDLIEGSVLALVGLNVAGYVTGLSLSELRAQALVIAVALAKAVLVRIAPVVGRVIVANASHFRDLLRGALGLTGS